MATDDNTKAFSRLVSVNEMYIKMKHTQPVRTLRGKSAASFKYLRTSVRPQDFVKMSGVIILKTALALRVFVLNINFPPR